MMMQHPRRRLRNYLLDYRFQLKYSLMVVAITAVIASVLGYVALNYSRGQTEALTIQIAAQPDLDVATARDLRTFAEAHDRRVFWGIVAGIMLISIALGLTGVVVTHKVVGPARKMKWLMEEIAKGHYNIQARLRKRDELHDVFDSMVHMVQKLRDRREQRRAALEIILNDLRDLPNGQEVIRKLEQFLIDEKARETSKMPPPNSNV